MLELCKNQQGLVEHQPCGPTIVAPVESAAGASASGIGRGGAALEENDWKVKAGPGPQVKCGNERNIVAVCCIMNGPYTGKRPVC